METASAGLRFASLLALLAAFLWATYYFFVLGLAPGVASSALIVYPFLFGSVCYFAWIWKRGELSTFSTLWKSPAAYLRLSLNLAMQLLVLASTYLAGPIDTSLLSLVGDVVLTPLLVMGFYREGRHAARSVAFIAGVGLCTVGASLTIVGGQSFQSLHGFAWIIAPLLPIAVAAYFLLTARASRTVSYETLVTHSTIGAALAAVALTPLFPGGFAGLVVAPIDLLFLAILGITSFFLAPFLYFRSIRVAGLVLPAILMAAIPVFTLILSYFILGSIPPLIAALGIPIAVVGAVLAFRGLYASAGAPSVRATETTFEGS